jgi:hypothetical protein
LRPVGARTLASVGVFALPIGLSAFLLFSVEPLVGRLVLPVFGGTPAVWATVLSFFQAVLLAGYLYGHISITRFGRWGPPVHLTIAALGFVALAVAPASIGELRVESVSPVADLVRILFITIGVPAFVLTATTPLVSGWFEAARSGRQGDPYWLYALSNGGSLLALLAYPLIVEPRIGLASQRGAWAAGYAVLVVLLALAAARVSSTLRARAVDVRPIVAPPVTGAPPRTIDWGRRARWLLLAAVPSGLLSAVTTFIATDLVSAPLLWVAPLAIYLGSFIIAFSPRGGRPIGAAVIAAPAMITLLWVPYGSAGGWPILVILAMELLAFGVVAVALHGRLAQDRPDPAHLTEYYLILSAGGALASAFVALLAPIVFPGIWEYPILLVGALVALTQVSRRTHRQTRPERGLDLRPFVDDIRARFAPYLAGAVVLFAALAATGSLATEAGVRWLLVGGLVLAVGARPWFLAASTAFVLVLATFVLQPAVDFRARSFFGVTEVQRPPGEARVVLFNGTTVHGTQSTDPALSRTATTYYGPDGPAGDLFATVGDAGRADESVGVVGLGAGTLAAYAAPGMTMSFFEIDPIVIQVASDPRYFTYLSDAPRPARVVLGDARLSLEHEPAGGFDLLVLDAFSSDAIPVHLLTVEAIADELRTIRPNGLLAFHVSNRYYDLGPAIAAGAQASGLTVLERFHTPSESARAEGATPSHWLAASADALTIASLTARGWSEVVPADRPFTDDYADLIRFLHVTD